MTSSHVFVVVDRVGRARRLDLTAWAGLGDVATETGRMWCQHVAGKSAGTAECEASACRWLLERFAALPSPPRSTRDLTWSLLRQTRGGLRKEARFELKLLMTSLPPEKLADEWVDTAGKSRVRSASKHGLLSPAALVRGRARTVFEPDGYPHATTVARELCACLSTLPPTLNDVTRFFMAARSLAAHLDGLGAAAPEALRFVSADMLDAWHESEATRTSGRTSPRSAVSAARALRLLLLNRPPDVEFHDSVVSAQTGAVLWGPAQPPTVHPTEDLPFGTLETVRLKAVDVVSRARWRVHEVRRRASRSDSSDDEEGRWYAATLAGETSRADLARRFGEDPLSWPPWLRALAQDAGKSFCGRGGWVGVAYRRSVERCFPTWLEIAACWVLLMVSTGLPPESVEALESDWFHAAVRETTRDGLAVYGPVCRLRWPKERIDGPTQPQLYPTKGSLSPVRLRDLIVDLTADLRRLDPGLGQRLLLMVAGRVLLHGDPPTAVGFDHAKTITCRDGVSRVLFAAFLEEHVLTNHDEVEAWNADRMLRHEERGRRQKAKRHRRALLPPRQLQAWVGPKRPQRIRKTVRTLDLLLHGAFGAARDHLASTLVVHYTTSQVTEALSAQTVRDYQAAQTEFVRRRLAVAAGSSAEDDRASVSEAAGVARTALDAILDGAVVPMSNGVVCIDPGAPPSEFGPVAVDGKCALLGTDVCVGCPNGFVTDAVSERVRRNLESITQTLRLSRQEGVEAALRHQQRMLERVLDVLAVLDVPAASQSPLPIKGVDSYRQRRRRRS